MDGEGIENGTGWEESGEKGGRARMNLWCVLLHISAFDTGTDALQRDE